MPPLPPLCLPSRTDTRQPKYPMPAGSIDCHCHVFGDPTKFPLTTNRSYTPTLEPLEKYQQMCEIVGIDRTVQMNSAVYGFDNSITLALIAKLGQNTARGICGIDFSISSQELDRLNNGGMRGARLSTKVKGYGGMDLVEAIAKKIRPVGWHVDLHIGNNAELAEFESQLMELPVPIVVDHMGGVKGSDNVDAPGFQALLRMIRQRDDCWVKISSYYRASLSGPPVYSDMKAFAQALVETRADRLVWGSNWPHPNRYVETDVPNDGDLVDIFSDWVPDANTRRKILVDNPTALYGFK